MNINEMSDMQKSVMLARLCGWELVRREWKGALKLAWYNNNQEPLTRPQTIDISAWGDDLETMMCPDLYVPKNMALAWRVLNWAGLDLGGINNRIEFHEWFYSQGYDAPLWECLEPADAQRAWLDKVLELAIEAGMVTK